MAAQSRLELPGPCRGERTAADSQIAVLCIWNDQVLHLYADNSIGGVACVIEEIIVCQKSAAQRMRVLVGINILDASQLLAAAAQQGLAAKVFPKVQPKNRADARAVCSIDHLDRIPQFIPLQVVSQGQPRRVGYPVGGRKISQQGCVGNRLWDNLPRCIRGPTSARKNKLKLVLAETG